MTSTNWGGNYRYLATTIHRPASMQELADCVANAPRMRPLGSRHSFTDIADSAELINLGDMPEIFEVDQSSMTARVSANMTYGRFAELAEPHDIALHNLASLPHITIAGAIATATHGSGSSNGNLATAVAAIEIVTASGELAQAARGDADFDGMVVNLGALGVVTAITLDVEPTYDVAQYVFEAMPWQQLTDQFDDIFAAGHSVSAFSRYGNAVETLWIKTRTTDARRSAYVGDKFLGAPKATQRRHPIISLPADNCTVQQGIAGSWADRLPHFQVGFSPSAGDEIQSEFFVPIEHATVAIAALRDIAPQLSDAMLVSEIRTVAADDLWMSPQYKRATVAFHFTWRLDQPAAEAAAALVASVLEPFGVLPHWGKVFPANMAALTAIDRRRDFADLVARLDPTGRFRNDWLRRHVL